MEKANRTNHGAELAAGENNTTVVQTPQLPHVAGELDTATNLPQCGTYTIAISGPDDEGDFFATVREFSGCLTHASDPVDAVLQLTEAMRAWIEAARVSGCGIPVPTWIGSASVSSEAERTGEWARAQRHDSSTSAPEGERKR